ncbi:hypothetical protein FHG87_000941 [Trinorchestia longiramus]|nr:hypothetical protein FHG87_000941 [Trinorchestia longiramus]
MSNPIQDIFFSKMTLLLPSQDRNMDGNREEIVSYTWDENETTCERKKNGGPEASFVETLPTFETNFSNFRNLSSHDVKDTDLEINTSLLSRVTHALENQDLGFDRKPVSPSNWYNYCLAIRDEKQSLDSRGEFRAANLSRTSSVSEESSEDSLFPGELRVKCLDVDPKILTGFNYAVRLADSNKHLFHGSALKLVSIGRGYGKRITFESESAVCNDNYFYSDTHAAGYGFRLVAVEAGQKFTLRDNFGNAVGFASVSDVMDQIEESQEINSSGQVKKFVRVSFCCDLEKFNDFGGFQNQSVEGTAVLLREKSNGSAVLTEIVDCRVAGEEVGFTFFPGVDEKERIFFVSGDVGDIPASYIVTGLLPHELPVIGTFVHPSIIVGAKYQVRNLDNGKYLFNGRALTLQSIGRGYGKRITFSSDSSIHNENYFYSDTNEGGFGFTVEALSVGDTFRIVNTATGAQVGYAEVYRADKPQRVIQDPCRGFVDVEVTCNIDTMGEICTVRVTGKANVEKTGSKIHTSVTDISLGGSLSHLSDESLQFLPM